MPTPDPLIPRTLGSCQTYVVAGGNHVTVLLDRARSDQLDVIDVHAAPGGGPPAHRHAFAEWFRVLEGELRLCEERDATMRPTSTLRAGDSVFVPPWTYHGTLNLSDSLCRFQVVGQPAMMSGYFAEAGVPVPDFTAAPGRSPAGPAELRELAQRWGIEFWTGPTELAEPGGRPVRRGGSDRS